MKFIKIDGATMEIGANQDEYETLHVREDVVAYPVGSLLVDTPRRTFAVQPTPEEIARIMAGEHIEISFLGYAFPPVSICVGDMRATDTPVNAEPI